MDNDSFGYFSMDVFDFTTVLFEYPRDPRLLVIIQNFVIEIAILFIKILSEFNDVLFQDSDWIYRLFVIYQS